jgi:hypothetical protein
VRRRYSQFTRSANTAHSTDIFARFRFLLTPSLTPSLTHSLPHSLTRHAPAAAPAGAGAGGRVLRAARAARDCLERVRPGVRPREDDLRG